jgi:predicted small secreted protein
MVQKLAAVALVVMCLGVAACNTVRGAAQDV